MTSNRSPAEYVRRKQPFTSQEDIQLLKLVGTFGTNWKAVSTYMNGRTQRQCRERYRTYLAPGIKNDPWTKEEDDIVKEKYLIFGPKWALISTFVPGRSDNSIKNRFNNHININGKFLNEIQPLKKDTSLSDSLISSSPEPAPLEEISILQIVPPMKIHEEAEIPKQGIILRPCPIRLLYG